jgi:hypothetical protein
VKASIDISKQVLEIQKLKSDMQALLMKLENDKAELENLVKLGRGKVSNI